MERSTPVRKSHTSTADLLVWTETPPAERPAPDADGPGSRPGVRSHQPSGGISAVLYGVQLTDEEAESAMKRKPCSDYKLREITGSGIFSADKEENAAESGGINSKTGLRLYQQAASTISQISFVTEESVSPKKPVSIAEVAQQRELSGSLETEAESRLKKQISDAKITMAEEIQSTEKLAVVFVLGGPGSGKGTQCANIVEHFGFTHLSAGDLLRAEIKSGSENGTMIQNMIKEGKIVPSEVTIKLLQKAMLESGNNKFLIDGFPRNEENRAAFEEVTKIEPEFVLFFNCPEEEMERRVLSRNQGRDDDNIETIRKRFKVYVESSIPVVEYYESKGKVQKVDAAKPVGEVFESVKSIFAPFS